MRSTDLRRKALAAAIAALAAAAPASAAAEVDFLARPGVSDAVLAGFRGGISTADVFWTFSVVRTVSVNNTSVLRQELTIGDLRPLIQSGIVPQITAQNLGAGVAVGSGNSLTDAIAGQTIGNPAVAAQSVAPQQAPAAPQSAVPMAVAAPQSAGAAPVIASPQQANPAAPVQAAPATPSATPVQQAAAQPAAAPAAAPSSAQATAQTLSPTTPLVVNIPMGNGTVQAIVLNLPNAMAIAQNTVNGVNMSISTQFDVTAKVLDAARANALAQQIRDSVTNQLPR